MKNIFFLAALCCATLTALQAQITVPATTFPAPSDVLRYVQAANPGVAIALYTPPGGNQVWDLSALTAASTFEKAYLPAAQGVYTSQFPAATMVVKNATSEYYYRGTDTKLEVLGEASTTVGGLPLLAIYQYQPPMVDRYAPLKFFDIRQNSSSVLIAWKFSDLPAGAVNLPLQIDSIRFRTSEQTLDVVDAWGALTLPASPLPASFPVLRQKRTHYREARVDAKVPPLGWLDVTDQILQNGGPWAPLFGVDTVVTHHFLNDVSKEEIAVLTFNNAQNAVTSVVYKNTLPASSVSAADPIVPPLKLYPNPATSEVTVLCADMPSGLYALKIFDSGGRLMTNQVHFLTENTALQVVLPAGMIGLYQVGLEDAKGNVVGMGRLVVTQH